ncbi:hypothetical protein HAX54_052484 [Datura stramonium]|uniref:RRM domain-containing protein n=1 Tax=Datura stramonium TaxID=4076 RepID=A0ABS8T0U7_DATST|nr:hypothetical protein [Datura stramonium]
MAAVPRSLLNPQAPEYIPLCRTNNNDASHPPSFPPTPYLFSTPPPLPSPAPFPTVGSPPGENVRLPSARRERRNNIPPRMRNIGCAARQGGSNGNRGVCYGKWTGYSGLKKHDVIPLSWSRKNNTTTVMIKNIPYDYNREMLMKFMDEHCLLENQKARDSNEENILFAYDFLYLPMDFKNKKSKGYAFVNFTDHRTVWKFFWAFNDKLDVFPGSAKRVKIVTAKIQGKEALVQRFKETRFECESEGFLPVWFNPPRDGSGKSVQMITVGKCKVTPSCSYILKKP